MGTLVLVRHGESRWNLANRFSGWVDIPLSEGGIAEADRVAHHCRKFQYTSVFTSLLQRAISTVVIILAHQNKTGIFHHPASRRYTAWIRHSNILDGTENIPVFTTAALNERYYGSLQGMKKSVAEKKYGKDNILKWRRGYCDRPPKGETLEEAHKRMIPYLKKHILPRVKKGETVLLTAHGNTLRAVIKHLEGISNTDIAFVDLPEAMPLVYAFREKKFIRIEGEYHFNRPLR